MQLISTVVTFVAAFVFAMLEHRSPKRDWEFIERWPWLALAFISMVVGSMEYSAEQAQQWRDQNPMPSLVCVTITGDYGIPEKKCDWVTKPGAAPPPPSAGIINMITDIFVSVLLDIPPSLAGLTLGKRTARRMDRNRMPA
jgi:hypothetical protein